MYTDPLAEVAYEGVITEEAHVVEELAAAATAAELDQLFAEDDPLPITTIDLDEDPADTEDPCPESDPDHECGADPDDPGTP